MKLVFHLIIFLLTCFTSSATFSAPKIAIPSNTLIFQKTENASHSEKAKIGVENYARRSIEEPQDQTTTFHPYTFSLSSYLEGENWCDLDFQETTTQNQVTASNFSKKDRLSKLENRAREVLGVFVNGAGKVFNSIDEAVLAHIDDISSKLYRGDTRSIDEIFNNGFTAKGSGENLFDYVESNTPSIFIGTTKKPSVATSKFLKDKKGYVYIIDKKGSMTDVNNFYSAMGDINIHADEFEVVIENAIPTSQIKGAFEIDVSGNVIGDLIINPNYIP